MKNEMLPIIRLLQSDVYIEAIRELHGEEVARDIDRLYVSRLRKEHDFLMGEEGLNIDPFEWNERYETLADKVSQAYQIVRKSAHDLKRLQEEFSLLLQQKGEP